MNLQIIISKSTAFYYWVQLMTNWDIYGVTGQAYRYYMKSIELSDGEKNVLIRIADIYKHSNNPYGINYELYSGEINSDDAVEVCKLAEVLRRAYEPIWNNNYNDIVRLKSSLENMNIASKSVSLLKKLNHLFDTDVDLSKKYPVYILPNTPGVGGSSLGKPGGNDTLMVVSTRKPKIISRRASDEKIALTIYHEYCHAFAKNSTKFNNLISEGVGVIQCKGLAGFTSAGFAKEAVTRAIAQPDYDSLMASLASSERVNKPLDIVEQSASSTVPSGARSHAICTILSLKLLSMMKEYIAVNRVIDDNFVRPILNTFKRLR